MTVSIFYSWQSDLPNSTNRNFIENALEAAIKLLKNQLSATLVPCLDRDTQNTPGTPDIASTIFRKIDESNVFVCDISIIHPKEVSQRRTPNPNVLFELGYAAKHLGWERIICVYNKTFGGIDELPFDLRTRRILTYCVEDKQIEKTDERKLLTRQLTDAIKSIVEHESQSKKTMSRLAEITLEVVEGLHLPTFELKRKEREKKHAEARRLFDEAMSIENEEHRAQQIGQLFAGDKLPIKPPEELIKEYRFRLGVYNAGKVTIRNLRLEITCKCNEGFWVGPDNFNEYAHADGVTHTFRLSSEKHEPILPDERREFPETYWTVKVPEGKFLQDGNIKLYWKALLDNESPSIGTLDLFDVLRQCVPGLG